MDKLMSHNEVKRAQILDLLKADRISQLEAARQLGVTPRQVRRLAKRYQVDGLAGLVSKKRGSASNRRLDEATCTTAVSLIGTHYRDFGPTLACEKLAERHELHLSVESARQMMIKAGYWRAKKGGTVCTHPMRERRARFGEMIQIDGSPHDWFEGRGDYCTLLVFIDDATGKLTQLRFAPTETTLDYMQVLHDHILAHGTPVTLYSDKHSIFRINAVDADRCAETQFSRAARELGIECIHAASQRTRRARQPDLAGSSGQGNAAGRHRRHGRRQRVATGLHCGPQPAFCSGAKRRDGRSSGLPWNTGESVAHPVHPDKENTIKKSLLPV